MSLHADLASLSSSLDQMLERVEAAVVEVEGTTNEDLLVDLFEVERSLRTANRRLNRILAARNP
jgi:hypothetical protein